MVHPAPDNDTDFTVELFDGIARCRALVEEYWMMLEPIACQAVANSESGDEQSSPAVSL